MNLFEGVLTQSANTQDGSLSFGSQSIAIPQNELIKREGLSEYYGKPLIFGIRPEDLEDAALPSAPAGPTINGEVSLVESLGSEIMVHFGVDAAPVDSGDPDAVAELGDTAVVVGRFSPKSRIDEGEMAEVTVNVEGLHFFDPETRLAI